MPVRTPVVFSGLLALAACNVDQAYQNFLDNHPTTYLEDYTSHGGGAPTTGHAPAMSTTTGEDPPTPTATGIGVEDTGSSMTTTGGEAESSGGTTGPAEQAPPQIVGMSLSVGPGPLKSAGPVVVMVQTEDTMKVSMTVDAGEAVALTPVGGGEFVGEIPVLGESWNGLHTVSAVAKSGELESAPWPEMFEVTVPAAGSEAWKQKSPIVPSLGNAVAVDAAGAVYELFTESGAQGDRCHVRRRDPQGAAVWPKDTVVLAGEVACAGEDIVVHPDGTVWVLVNTRVAQVDRWRLYHLDAAGKLLADPQIGDFEESGRGLDVNAAGELLLCGTRPGDQGEDAWVHLRPPVGDGWTMPWVYELDTNPFAERTRDCAFVEDRIVVVGEAFGQHEPNDLDYQSRAFVAEYGFDGALLAEVVAPSSLAWQSGYEAVAPDGGSEYVAVGYTCDAEQVPCNPAKGLIVWFDLDVDLAWAQSVTTVKTVWAVAPSPSGGLVVAGQAIKEGHGFLVEAWALAKGTPSWSYNGTPGKTQVATGIALNKYGSVYAGGFYVDGGVLAAAVVKLHPY